MDNERRQDPLTKLHNRRHLYLEGPKQFSMPHRLVLCGFSHDDQSGLPQKINDSFGHTAGDKVLVEVAATLLKHCRTYDVLIRFGGEEFTLVMLNCRIDRHHHPMTEQTDADNKTRTAPATDKTGIEYAGFWIRVAATLIDSLLIILITVPLLYGIYGEHYFNRDLFITGLRDFLISWVLPALAAVMFWIYLSATPGKVILHLKIIAAGSSGHPFPRQFVIRYLAYFIASIPLGAGLLRGAFDVRKQGRHDKLANTVVIRER